MRHKLRWLELKNAKCVCILCFGACMCACMCVCMCVCEREWERKWKRERENKSSKLIKAPPACPEVPSCELSLRRCLTFPAVERRWPMWWQSFAFPALVGCLTPPAPFFSSQFFLPHHTQYLVMISSSPPHDARNCLLSHHPFLLFSRFLPPLRALSLHV